MINGFWPKRGVVERAGRCHDIGPLGREIIAHKMSFLFRTLEVGQLELSHDSIGKL